MSVFHSKKNVSFTLCKDFMSAKTSTGPWNKVVEAASKSVEFKTKEESISRAAIIGGVRKDENKGRRDNIFTREMLILDYDNFPEGTTYPEVKLALKQSLKCAFIAFTTFSHTPQDPRIRVIIPLKRTVTETQHQKIVEAVEKIIGLEGLDACSKKVNQLMFLPSHKAGVDPQLLVGPGDFFDVDGLGLQFSEDHDIHDTEPQKYNGSDSLEALVASAPLDISDEKIKRALENYPASSVGYEDWFQVGMALHHQYEGSDKGYNLWTQWSQKDGERFKPKEMPIKWRSFGGRSVPITVATLIKAAGGLEEGGALTISPISETGTSLIDEASLVSDIDAYSSYKNKVKSLSDIELPNDTRDILVSKVYKAFGKAQGITIGSMRDAFSPLKVKSNFIKTNETLPEWAMGWVFYEPDGVFVKINQPEYRIAASSFNARYGREQECASCDLSASHLVLHIYRIPTVERLFYLPDTEERIVERDGFVVLNTYVKSGITPCEDLDNEGQYAVDLFLTHIKNTFSNPDEQRILLDWMAHLVQNPGIRVNWAILIWGIEGNGKTFFFNIMQKILGQENTKDISPSSVISGYNDWAAGGTLGNIEEIRLSGTNKWQTTDCLKAVISNETIGLNPKGKTAISNVPNYCSYMMTTNHKDAIPVSDNDRRFFVLFSWQDEEQDLFNQHGGEAGVEDYFTELFGLVVRERPDAIARYLMDHEISSVFKPKGRAPKTAGHAEMKDANIHDDVSSFRSILEDYSCEVLNDEIVCVTALKAAAVLDLDDPWILPGSNIFGRLLRGEGYSRIQSKFYKIKGVKHYVWIRKNRIPEDEVKTIVRDYYTYGRLQELDSVPDDLSDIPF